MPKAIKRKQSDSIEFETINKRLKQLENMIKNTCRRSRSRRRRSPSEGRRRRRRRVIESSSEASSRDTSPQPNDPSDGGSSESREAHQLDTRMTTAAEVHAAPSSPASAHPSAPAPPSAAAPPSEIARDSLLSDILDSGGPPTAADTQLPGAPNSTAAQPPDVTEGNESRHDEELDSIILEILGEDPTATTAYGKEIHKELASRFEHIATTGLTKEARKELFEKYLTPSNCIRTGAPILNAEIKAALPESLQKRDKGIEARQKQLATAISCLAELTTEQLTYKEKNHDLIKKLMDTGRVLCDLQHAESTTRRSFAMYALKRDMKEHLQYTKIDKYLFGENLADALKTAKAVNKSGTDLKVDNKANKNPRAAAASSVTKAQPSKALNWKPPAPARRQPGPQRSREPASRRSLPATSSRPSFYPPRPTRRR